MKLETKAEQIAYEKGFEQAVKQVKERDARLAERLRKIHFEVTGITKLFENCRICQVIKELQGGDGK